MLFKKRLVVISKSDFLDDELKQEIRKQLDGVDLMFISAVAQQGLVELKDALWKIIQDSRQQ
jgi:GTP-binding protein